MAKAGYTTPFGKERWYDVSDYVVHLTKDVKNGAGAGAVLESVLAEQRLIPGPMAFGQARGIAGLGDSQRCVCFSEAPLGFLDRLARRRGACYGIAFTKTFLGERGGGPVWYLPGNKALDLAFHDARVSAMQGGVDPDDPIWELTPFVDSVTPQYRFEWEREWRHKGELCFEPGDVAFLLAKEDMHETIHDFFENVAAEETGPVYWCPIVDPRWSVEQVLARLQPAA